MRTKSRSGWPVREILAALGIAARSYYRWLKEEAWAKERPADPPTPVSPYEALSGEKEAMIAYTRKRPELRHRELARRMVDEGVAFLSPSTVYRILKEADLVCPWRRRAKRKEAADEKATRPDQRWSTDLMHVQVGECVYYFVAFLDEYSRYIVHHELLLGMDGLTVSLAARKAIEALPKGPDGKPKEPPEVRSDNGSCYVSKEFRVVLQEDGMGHHRIHPHCPEEDGLMERANRTLREGLEGEELNDLLTSEQVMIRVVRRYNEGRLHGALGYLPPWEFYRASHRSGSRRGGSSCPRPGIAAGNGTRNCDREPCHRKGGRLFLNSGVDLCHYG